MTLKQDLFEIKYIHSTKNTGQKCYKKVKEVHDILNINKKSRKPICLVYGINIFQKSTSVHIFRNSLTREK